MLQDQIHAQLLGIAKSGGTVNARMQIDILNVKDAGYVKGFVQKALSPQSGVRINTGMSRIQGLGPFYMQRWDRERRTQGKWSHNFAGGPEALPGRKMLHGSSMTVPRELAVQQFHPLPGPLQRSLSPSQADRDCMTCSGLLN